MADFLFEFVLLEVRVTDKERVTCEWRDGDPCCAVREESAEDARGPCAGGENETGTGY